MIRIFWFLTGLLFTINLFSQTGASLPPWQEGFLDIHHISTGRGDVAYLIFPDGTTLLVDAGDISETHPRTLSPRNGALKPNRSRTAPEWIVDYIRQFAPATKPPVLDYALITHYHDDHFGEWDETRKISAKGGYALTGIMAVGEIIPVRKLLDRGYDFPINLKDPLFAKNSESDEYHILQTLREYWKFSEYHQKNNGLIHEKLRPGATDQIVLQHNAAKFPSFSVRNITSNGQVWTGFGDNTFVSLFREGEYPGENPLSNAIRISYGAFDYFTGGDIAGVNAWGEGDLNSVEANVAPVIGPVDVATLNHHGNRDSQSAFYVRTLRPRVWIGQTWSSDHPGDDVLRRITSQTLYPGERDLFATDMLLANEQVIGSRIENSYQSRHGHVVVRVSPGGKEYRVFVLSDASEKREVLAVFGPYASR
ncbi:MAG: hypothetical protein R3C61_18630 [Bacteroidia bacterium]